MAYHFISVLGTTSYNSVLYGTEDFRCKRKQEFVQLAIIEQFHDKLLEDGSKITICVTEQSKKLNYNDRMYTQNERDNMHINNELTIKIGLENQLREQFPELADRLECVDIGCDRTEEDRWLIFKSILGCINEEDKIIFDITHCFRSIPIIVLAAINYAKVLKNCSIENILYGAFEKDGNSDYTPLVELSIFYEILEWSNAARMFTEYGNAEVMNKMFDNKFKSIPDNEKGNWSNLKKIVKTAEIVSNSVMTCRGADDIYCVEKKKDISIKGAYRSFVKNNIEKEPKDAAIPLKNISDVEPLEPLFKKVEDRFKVFAKEENYMVGFATVKWCVDYNMVQQGYTALEESLKTYLCFKYGLDELDSRDSIIGKCINMLNVMAMDKNYSIEDKNSREEYINNAIENGQIDSLNCEIIKNVFMSMPLELAKSASLIKDKRNDINHFGMRKNPESAKSLKDNLDKLYNNVINIIRNEENQ